ncbi:hypothetical protein MMC07_004983 [Pseudocyphellaria aurata]|nr:hypothetical protein [Pseudocyphellaria aurata]
MWAQLTLNLSRIFLVIIGIYLPLVWLVKLSLFLLLLQIFNGLRWMRYFVYFGVTLTGLFYLSVSIVLIVLCAPRDGQSQTSYPLALASRRCEPSKAISYSVGIFNVVTDFYLLILPLPAVWSLQLPIRKKIGVSAIFLTGLVACICSIVGVVYRAPVSLNSDYTWTVIPLWIVITLEMTAGVIIPCMPMVAVVYRDVRLPIFSFLEKYKKKLDTTIFGTTQKHTASGSTEELRPTYEMNQADTSAMSQSGPAQVKIDPDTRSGELQPGLAPRHTHIYKGTEVEISRVPQN